MSGIIKPGTVLRCDAFCNDCTEYCVSPKMRGTRNSPLLSIVATTHGSPVPVAIRALLSNVLRGNFEITMIAFYFFIVIPFQRISCFNLAVFFLFKSYVSLVSVRKEK